MTRIDSVAIVGLGLIGGSVARGLANAGIEVVAFDSNREHVDAAIEDRVVARAIRSDFSDLGSTDVVVIAVEGDASCEVLSQLASSAAKPSLVTDVGSTKRTIVANAAKSSLAPAFVGSHPFAGDHRSGWSASRADLFAGQVVYLCPTAQSSKSAMEMVHDLWTMLGAKPQEMDAARHDALLAWTSHLPHMVSTAFALSLNVQNIDRGKLGRGGRDVARLAAGSTDVWTAIAMDNADELVAAVEAMQLHLGELGDALRARDLKKLRAQLTEARAWCS